MPVMVALLRGVNVGGKTTLSMAKLKDIAERCGFDAVRTYIQSGNLLFSTSRRSPQAVARTLERAIAEATPLTPKVIVRTRSQLASVVERNPFAARGESPAHLHTVFVGGTATAKLPLDDLDRYAPEEAVASGQELFLYLPNGVGRSPLAADLAKQMGPTGTMRNWRTVTKLLDLAGELG